VNLKPGVHTKKGLITAYQAIHEESKGVSVSKHPRRRGKKGGVKRKVLYAKVAEEEDITQGEREDAVGREIIKRRGTNSLRQGERENDGRKEGMGKYFFKSRKEKSKELVNRGGGCARGGPRVFGDLFCWGYES